MPFGRREEDFTQMEYPIRGASTDVATAMGMFPEEGRKEIIRNKGLFTPTEYRSALIAENKIRAMNRQNRELPQHNISKERV